MKYVCRVCGFILSTPVVLLEQMPLTDDFINIANILRKEYIKDIQIFECEKCGLVQNPGDFDHENYYHDYQYSSGRSAFVKNFMRSYAEVIFENYKQLNNTRPRSVLEIGSGDGEQLKQFKILSVPRLLGIEPSDYLAKIARASGIPTQIDLFGAHSKVKLLETFDVCLSSYTLDHVRSPIAYLQTAHDLLSDGGLLAFEVHDLNKIVDRTEYCLFEHEHTIYLTPETAVNLVQSQGFDVTAINPLPSNEVRGNSLVVIARKLARSAEATEAKLGFINPRLHNINNRIKNTIARLELWIDSLSSTANLVGFGAGGRGVMTLGALKNSRRFVALFDSNQESEKYLSPKTRIPIVGPDGWSKFSESYCLVFSYGYFIEIKKQLLEKGFNSNKIFSLEEFFPMAGSD
jgi:SAM-dependent methyltransferase